MCSVFSCSLLSPCLSVPPLLLRVIERQKERDAVHQRDDSESSTPPWLLTEHCTVGNLHHEQLSQWVTALQKDATRTCTHMCTHMCTCMYMYTHTQGMFGLVTETWNWEQSTDEKWMVVKLRTGLICATLLLRIWKFPLTALCSDIHANTHRAFALSVYSVY